MKHAGSAALDRLEPLLRALRKNSALTEKSRGTFYRGGRAFLHFHEHREEFFADLRLSDDFERLPATSGVQQSVLLKKIDAALQPSLPDRRAT
jgi:hypothetical protein